MIKIRLRKVLQRFRILLWLIGFFGVLTSTRAYALTPDEIRQRAIRINAVNDFVVEVAIGADAKDRNVLAVRLNQDDEYEIIATGKVSSQKGELAKIQIDGSSMKKRPRADDFVVFLGPPMDFTFKKPDKPGEPFEMKTGTEEVPENGYISLSSVSITETLKSESTTRANSYKGYNSVGRSGYSLEWFLEFLPSYGIKYVTGKGALPIRSYYRENVDASISETKFRLMYRMKRRGWFRFTGFFESADEQFATSNPDEYVIGTQASLTKLGASLSLEYGDLLLLRPSTWAQFTDLKVELLQIVAGRADDGLISRGSGNIQGQEMSVSAGFTFYLPWMPWVKRYTLAVESFTSKRSMSFSGVTRSENSQFYEIPEGGSGTESYSGYRIWLGVRFEDVIGKALKPKG